LTNHYFFLSELWHPARFAYHQFAVKIMASYPALLALRNELASLSLKAEEKKKNAFFAEAFHTAYKILFEYPPHFILTKKESQKYAIKKSYKRENKGKKLFAQKETYNL
jgi:hypothetical protein